MELAAGRLPILVELRIWFPRAPSFAAGSNASIAPSNVRFSATWPCDRVVVRVNHNLAAQIDSLRLGAGAENTK